MSAWLFKFPENDIGNQFPALTFVVCIKLYIIVINYVLTVV